jgi:hypothetical protein
VLLSASGHDAAAAIPEPEPPSKDLPPFGFGEPVDPYDPREVGWVVIVGQADPDRDAMLTAIGGLAAARGSPDAWGPIELSADADVFRWIFENVDAREVVPKYVVLLGSPRYVPFALQSALGLYHQVGRLDFSRVGDDGVEHQDVDALGRYVDKVLRLESAPARATALPLVMWAPSGGRRDPTFYSRRAMVEPLAHRYADKHLPLELLVDQRATKEVLLQVVAEQQPGVLFTASHGRAVAAPLGLVEQTRHNGSLVDQHLANLTVDDLPAPDQPFVEGGLVHAFACFGYGTPSTSGYTHWNAQVARYQADVAFVAALPKAMLALDRGPIAFVGHADYALLHAFADPANPGANVDALSPHLAKYREVLDVALHAVPCGNVLAPLTGSLAQVEGQLVQQWDDAQRAGTTPATSAELVDTFLRRNDARAAFLLGDPAARPRLTSKEPHP